jgi:hypothetical protein
VCVFVDGVFRGTTPLSAPLLVEAGQHSIRCERPGYRASEQVLSVAAGTLQATRCSPLPAPNSAGAGARLDVRVDVPGATVLVDGAPRSPSALPPGPHDIVVSHPGYRTWHQVVDLQAAGQRTLLVTLESRDTAQFASTERLRERRQWAYGLGAAGLLCGAASAITYWANSGRYGRWQRDRDETNALLEAGRLDASVLERNTTTEARAASVAWVDGLATGMAFAGGASLAAAVLAWTWGDDSPTDRHRSEPPQR